MTVWSNTGDKLIPTFYRVIINTSNNTNYPDTGTDGGAISPNTPAELIAAGGTAGTNAQARVKAQANLRWFRIVEALNFYTQAHFLNIDVTAETNVADTPTALGFTVFYEQDEYNIKDDLDSPGNNITGAEAIEQIVAEGMSGTYTRNMDLRQPSAGISADAFLAVTFTTVRTRSQIEDTDNIITVETSATGGSGIEETAQGT